MGVFLTLFVAASLPVVKVVLLCGVGAICARTGLLSYDGRKVLSGMAYIVFVPALNFTNLATSITPSRLLLWWPLVVNLFLSTGLGAGLGYLNAALVRPAPWFKNHTVAAVMFGNVGNLPLVIVATLARSSASILGGVDPEEATKLAISYVVLGLLAPILMQPTIGYRMLAKELFFKPDAPLQIMTDTLTMLGDCAIPVMIISLGATLSKGPGAARVPVRVIASVGVCRLVILPLVGMAVVMGSYAAGVFKAPDPIFLLVLLIQNTAPTAIMVHTMAAVHQNGDEEVSSVLFWQYLVSIVTIPPYLLLFMYIVRQVF